MAECVTMSASPSSKVWIWPAHTRRIAAKIQSSARDVDEDVRDAPDVLERQPSIAHASTASEYSRAGP